MLKVEHLNYAIDGKGILHDVSFSTRSGELWIVLGPNGAGKSSLLNILAGEHMHFSGEVQLANQALQSYSPSQLAQIRAVMPQAVQLDFAFQVQEVVEMGVLSGYKESVQKLIGCALDLFDLSHLAARNYLTLSGGEKQRVQLARVVAQLMSSPRFAQKQPQLLLLDECTANLDLAHQQQVFNVLKRLVSEYRITVLAIVHDLNLASQFADKAMLLNQGRLHAWGDKTEVLTQRHIEAVYQTPVTIIERHQAWSVIVPRVSDDN